MDLRAMTVNFGNTKNDLQKVTYCGVAFEADAVVRIVQYMKFGITHSEYKTKAKSWDSARFHIL
jgi:hypothetical protein